MSLADRNAAIFFEPEGYSISGPRLMGRNAAGHSFIKGFFQHAAVSRHIAFTTQPDGFSHFRKMAQEEGSTLPTANINAANFGALREAGCAFYPGPGLGPHAWQRELYGSRAWSLCGITHTTLSGRAMDALASLLSSPLHPWDALICTSRAVRDTVRAVLEAEADYLTHRLGATRFPLPQLPVIPLGVAASDFSVSDESRHAAREALGLEPDHIVVLFVGRLSFHAKAHPAALYQALEAAAGDKKIALIECGWFANDSIKEAFDEAADTLCPSVKRIVLDGRHAINRQAAWASADIFSSLTDNYQETFGITPVEAMAAGLPVVVTDWDGYRDSVRHGIDGFRIRTFAPPPGSGDRFARNHATEAENYDHFCGLTSQMVSVDIAQATEAFRLLFANPDLRKTMGAEGRARARADFDWSRIIPRYQDLWGALAEERRSAPDLPPEPKRREAWPARMDPFTAFASYPTTHLKGDLMITRVEQALPQDWNTMRGLRCFALGDRLLPRDDLAERILALVPTDRYIRIGDLLERIDDARDPVMFTLAWALKTGAIQAESEPLTTPRLT